MWASPPPLLFYILLISGLILVKASWLTITLIHTSGRVFVGTECNSALTITGYLRGRARGVLLSISFFYKIHILKIRITSVLNK